MSLVLLGLLLVSGCPSAQMMDDDDGSDDDDASDDDDSTQQNNPPTEPIIVLSPPDATSIDPLSCQVQKGSVDPDDDPIYYLFAWEVDGVDANNSTTTVDQLDTMTGQTWTCTVKAFDGALFSSPAVDSVTISAGNMEPSSPGIEIDPSAPNDASDLNCIITQPSVDPEGDPLSYYFEWSMNGAPAIFDQSVVESAETSPGQLWTCSVTPLTDFGSGPPASISVTIAP